MPCHAPAMRGLERNIFAEETDDSRYADIVTMPR
jgi:hypothetical protein